jgi:oxygen-independent coproporphyrinogen-3 oxidase
MNVPCLDNHAVSLFVKEQKARPQANKVLHTHPSPLYWHHADDKLRERWKQRARSAYCAPPNANFYLGIPFCIPTNPSHCGFCLFPSVEYTGRTAITDYLGYLSREAEMYKPLLQYDKLESVYVGGGTPNLLQNSDYKILMGIIHSVFGQIPDDLEKTLEGIPQLFDRDKIEAIKDAGFTRISMGVQQLGNHLLQYSGRKQTRQQVIRALEEVDRAGLSCNVDLIYGWPEQSVKDMLSDLDELVKLGVRHITHYQLNIAGPSNFSKKMRHLLPSYATLREMYRQSCEFLRSKGFHQATVYDWEKRDSTKVDCFLGRNAEKYRYEENLRNFLITDGVSVTKRSHMIGIGYAAISILFTWPDNGCPSWSQMNVRSLADYYARIGDGVLPVERQFLHQEPDLRLAWLFQSMQRMSIDVPSYKAIFGSSLFDEVGPIWNELEDRRWIVYDDLAIRFSDSGQYHIPLIQSLLSKARIDELRVQAPSLNCDNGCGK